MKNFVKLFGNLNRDRSHRCGSAVKVPFLFIALVVIVGFTMTACPTGDDDGGGNNGVGNAYIGEKLELSGQVYEMTTNQANYTITYTEYKGNLTISDNNGGSATITGGKLSYTIETPNTLQTWNALKNNLFYSGYDDVTASDQSVQGVILHFSYSGNSSGTYTYYSLSKSNTVYNLGNTSGKMTSEDVSYVYVDKDVTITGKGTTESGTSPDDYPYTYTTDNFSLALKKGWNAVYSTQVSSATYPTGKPDSISSVSTTETISLNNPDLRWVLDTYESIYGSP